MSKDISIPSHVKYTLGTFYIITLIAGALPLHEAGSNAWLASMVFSLVYSFILVEIHKRKKISYGQLCALIGSINFWILLMPMVHHPMAEFMYEGKILETPPDNVGASFASGIGILFFIVFSSLFLGAAFLNIKRYGLRPWNE